MAKAVKKVDQIAEGAHAVTISPPNFLTGEFTIVGTSPYVQARFSEKAKNEMMAKMASGQQARSKKARDARDFDADCRAALHISTEGWVGIPASSFRAAMISACRLVGYKMTMAKMSVFVESDGFDRVDGIPLVKIIGDWERVDMHARNQTGVTDIRVRPMFREWSAKLRIRVDGDQFSLTDVSNLLLRAGQQVGIGEGRPDSRMSNGLGWGMFRIAEA